MTKATNDLIYFHVLGRSFMVDIIHSGISLAIKFYLEYSFLMWIR